MGQVPGRIPLPARRTRATIQAMRRSRLLFTLAFSVSLTLARANAADPTGDGGEVHGMDMIGAAKTVAGWVNPDKPDAGKPWSAALGEITADDSRAQAKAIRTLILEGGRRPEVVADLTVLASDRDWRLRARIVNVCAGIGGATPAPLVLTLSHDHEPHVRELAALALGQCLGDAVFLRQLELLQAPESQIREAAAKSLVGSTDLRAIEPLTRQENEHDDLVKRAMRETLGILVARVTSLPTVVTLLGTLKDTRRDALLEASANLGDPRLCPPLTSIAADPDRAGRAPEASAWTQFLAVRGLATSGDYRAVDVLVALADGEATGDVRTMSADTLRTITGYGAAAGKAWRVWQTDNSANIVRLKERDAFLAALHDPAVAIDRAALAQWSIEDLAPLVEAVLGQPAGRISPWWPARALTVLRADDPERWSMPLAKRINDLPTAEQDRRLALIILLDDLGGPQTTAALTEVVRELKERSERELDKANTNKSTAPDHGPEIELLRQALTRRGFKKSGI